MWLRKRVSKKGFVRFAFWTTLAVDLYVLYLIFIAKTNIPQMNLFSIGLISIGIYVIVYFNRNAPSKVDENDINIIKKNKKKKK